MQEDSYLTIDALAAGKRRRVGVLQLEPAYIQLSDMIAKRYKIRTGHYRDNVGLAIYERTGNPLSERETTRAGC